MPTRAPGLLTAVFATVLATVFATACGTLGGDLPDPTALPNRGAAPYEKLTDADGAAVAILGRGEGAPAITGPSAIRHRDRVHLFVSVTEPGEPAHIARATSPDGIDFGPLEPVLTARDDLRAPSVVIAGDIDGDTWHLVFQIGDGDAIGHARSLDGKTFDRDETPLLSPDGDAETSGLHAPSLVRTGDGFALFYQAHPADGPPTIRRADLDPDLRPIDRRSTFSPGTDCEGFDGEPESCWDATGVTDPDVHLAQTDTGRPVWRLMYATPDGNIGFAASFDGRDWQRYPFNPILTGSERAPAQLRTPDRYLIYLQQGRRPPHTTVAINAAGRPTEDF